MARKNEVLVKLSDKELKIIKAKAEKEGLPLSTFMRMAALKYEG